jgi:hypothetical protein
MVGTKAVVLPPALVSRAFSRILFTEVIISMYFFGIQYSESRIQNMNDNEVLIRSDY